MRSKICTKCKKIKCLFEFKVDNTKSCGFSSHCKDCVNTLRRKLYKENPDKYKEQSKKWRLIKENKEKARLASNRWWKENQQTYNFKYYSSLDQNLKRLLRESKKRSNKFGLNFDLNLEDIKNLWSIQNGKCAVTNKSLSLNRGWYPERLSIDRIDPKKGYVNNNVRLICLIVNIMKSNMSDLELKNWCNLILKGNINDKS